MGLFGNKKKSGEPLRTLSEKDIQAKLYGHIRAEQRTVQEASLLQKSVSTSPASPDLFKEPRREPEPVLPRKNPEEPKKMSLAAKAAEVPGTLRDRSSKRPVPAVPGTFKLNLQPLAESLKAIIFKTAAFLAAILAAGLRLFTVIDFRKPAARRIVYGLLAGGTLASLLFGIHLLNLRRETAMKNPPKQAAPAPAMAETHPTHKVKVKRKPSVAEEHETVLSKPAPETKEEAKPAAATPAIAEPAKMKILTPDSAVIKPTSAAPSAAEGPFYVIQVATFATPEDAQKLAERFKAAGLSAYSKPLSRSGGRVYHCVFVGRYKSHQAADAALAEFKKKEVAQPFQDAFVRFK